jgi:hypothetical protein
MRPDGPTYAGRKHRGGGHKMRSYVKRNIDRLTTVIEDETDPAKRATMLATLQHQRALLNRLIASKGKPLVYLRRAST